MAWWGCAAPRIQPQQSCAGAPSDNRGRASLPAADGSWKGGPGTKGQDGASATGGTCDARSPDEPHREGTEHRRVVGNHEDKMPVATSRTVSRLGRCAHRRNVRLPVWGHPGTRSEGQMARLPPGSANAVDMAANYAYVGAEDLLVIDLSDPANPHWQVTTTRRCPSLA